MPETTQADASVAMYRCRDGMWVRCQRVGFHKWRFAAIDSPGESETAWQLVAAATEQLEGREAA
jgi:endonuclease YncB( thermonuclease family)